MTKAIVFIGAASLVAAYLFAVDEPPRITRFNNDSGGQISNKAGGQNCHPSYSGCLKADASDYDCAGGSGNGPYYTGRVRIIGSDVFGLDRDGDGWGCE